jgi:hypothetical protein
VGPYAVAENDAVLVISVTHDPLVRETRPRGRVEPVVLRIRGQSYHCVQSIPSAHLRGDIAKQMLCSSIQHLAEPRGVRSVACMETASISGKEEAQ